MALTATFNSTTNKVYGLDSHLARDLKIAFGTLAVTYSAAGGFTWSMPFANRLFTLIPPQSGYVFTYNCTTSMLMAFQASLSASTLVEVASDTDFTALSDSLRFVAFGY